MDIMTLHGMLTITSSSQKQHMHDVGDNGGSLSNKINIHFKDHSTIKTSFFIFAIVCDFA